MKRALLLSGAITAMLGAAPFVAVADTAASTDPANVQIAQAAGEVNAGDLVGQDVYDGNGEKVGEVDSVMVDPKGKVTSVILDVSGWLESEKLIALNWSDLKMGEDGKIVSALTKDSATSAEAYAYKDANMRGQVMTESGERYMADQAPADDMQADTADTTQPATTDTTQDSAAATQPATTDTTEPATTDQDNTAVATAPAGTDADDNRATAVVNADGSLNASKLIGLDVQSPEDKKVGDIGEVVLDKSGQVQGVVVDVGGFLGIGDHPVLLDWKDVTLASQDGTDRAVVNLTKEKLEQMPAYESSMK